MADPKDLSALYNTKLTPKQEAEYQAWATAHHRQNDTYDYDMRGAWLGGAAQAENGHYPDTYKKPNHPTFSDQSKYNGVDGFIGGSWVGDDQNGWSFQASPSNLHWQSPEQLQNYFKEREPTVKLLLPIK